MHDARLSTAATLLLVLAGPPAHGSPPPAATASYARRWYTVDGGGAIPSAQQPSGYRLGGTVGQPDACVSTGGGYRLVGGFWSGVNHTGNVGVEEAAPSLPAAFRALAPFPNPSHGASNIGFDLPEARDVIVRVCDVQGRLVRELDHSRREPGRHRLTWDGRDAAGGRAPRGLYFVHVDAGKDRGVTKLVLLAEGGAR
jgi:hypothetical protein